MCSKSKSGRCPGQFNSKFNWKQTICLIIYIPHLTSGFHFDEKFIVFCYFSWTPNHTGMFFWAFCVFELAIINHLNIHSLSLFLVPFSLSFFSYCYSLAYLHLRSMRFSVINISDYKFRRVKTFPTISYFRYNQ